jgi:hypothetical protein
MRSFIISTSCAIQPSVQQSANFLKHFERDLIIIKKKRQIFFLKKRSIQSDEYLEVKKANQMLKKIHNVFDTVNNKLKYLLKILTFPLISLTVTRTRTHASLHSLPANQKEVFFFFFFQQ